MKLRFSALFALVLALTGACTTPMAALVCGNGRMEGSEACDDGNTAPGDGCSGRCETEWLGDTGVELDARADLDASAIIDAATIDAGAADDDAPTDTGPLPDGAIGQACGARGTLPCAAGLDCVFEILAACGSFGSAGTCRARPTLCSRILAPVCGCDGLDYSNECDARAAGTSPATNGACPVGCDPDLVTCDTLAPRCVLGTSPRVRSGCWDGCVPTNTCECTTTADCPLGATCTATNTCG